MKGERLFYGREWNVNPLGRQSRDGWDEGLHDSGDTALNKRRLAIIKEPPPAGVPLLKGRSHSHMVLERASALNLNVYKPVETEQQDYIIVIFASSASSSSSSSLHLPTSSANQPCWVTISAESVQC